MPENTASRRLERRSSHAERERPQARTSRTLRSRLHRGAGQKWLLSGPTTRSLREHAAREGYEVLEGVEDPGQSGASLARPGLDRVRDLVAKGGVSIVLAQD